MEKPRCSFDSFDAIYICECECLLCPKHYFSHRTEFPNHTIERIKIPVNKESKKILISLILFAKQTFIAFFNIWSEESISFEITEKFSTESKFFSQILSLCDKSLRFLTLNQYIPFKLIYNPLEYFLIQPSSKTMKYVTSLRIPKNLPKNLSDIRNSIIFKHLFNFNYFQFEDQKYISNFIYEIYNSQVHLSNIIWPILIGMIKASDYEMAYELLRDLEINNEISPLSQDEFYFFNQLRGIINLLIQGTTLPILKEKWEEILSKFSHENFNWVSILIYEMFSIIFKKMNENLLAYGCLQRIIDNYYQNNKEKEANFYKLKLGGLYFENKNYEAAISCFQDTIRFYNESENLALLNESYFLLASVYSEIGKKENEIKKIIKYIEEKKIYQNKYEFDENICKFYCLTSDYDKTNSMLWKCIKNNKNSKNYYKLSNLYLHLGYIYMKINDFSKAHQAFSHAKSCCGLLSMGNSQVKNIYLALGKYYYNRQLYKDALESLRCIESYCTNIELQDVKFTIGLIYFELRDNDKSLEMFLEVKKLLFCSDQVNRSHLCIVNIMIGELYNRNGINEDAQSSFMEAFEHIDDYDWCLFDANIASPYYLFYYFLKVSDYDKCESILLRVNEILENNSNKQLKKSDVLVMSAELKINQGKAIEEVEESLQEAESVMKIDEFLLNSFKKTQPLSYADIINCIRIGQIRIKWKRNEDFGREEEILKYCEAVLDKFFSKNWCPKADLCGILGNLYYYQEKWEESKIYYTKSLELHNKHNSNWITIAEIQQCLENIQNTINKNQEL